MKREFIIRQFRNIGVDYPEKLLLNQFDEQYEFGSLVAIIGQNNTGKSNLLQAISHFNKDFYNENQSTEISLTFTLNNGETITKIVYSTGHFDLQTKFELNNIPISESDVNELNIHPTIKRQVNHINIYEYNEKDFINFTNQDFKIRTNRITQSSLLKCLFYDNPAFLQEFTGCDFGSKVETTKYLKEANHCLVTIMEKFNDLFFNNQYSFSLKIELQADYLNLILVENDKQVSFDEQSVGFKWFFKFVLNLSSPSFFEKGDIILIDEPAVNLHIRSILQLQKYLREFAIENGVTIVFSTHSPFLLNIHYLDEIRIMSKIENRAHISNFFYALNEEDTNVVQFIEEAITSDRNLIKEKYSKYIFVENVFDYVVLSYFNTHLNFTDKLSFLPFNGFHKTPDLLLKHIVSIDEKPVFLLTDSVYSRYLKSHQHIKVYSLDQSFRNEKFYQEIIYNRYKYDIKHTGVLSVYYIKELFKQMIENF